MAAVLMVLAFTEFEPPEAAEIFPKVMRLRERRNANVNAKKNASVSDASLQFTFFKKRSFVAGSSA